MKRSKFSLSHFRLMSGNQGFLLPCSCLEVLPGDSIQWSTHALIRAAPLVSPVMHPVQVRIHHFYVPYRLIWSAWQNFITGGPDGLDASVFPTVSIALGGGTNNTLADYLGVPTLAGTYTISALPFRAYNLIWNEYYRDQDLEAALVNSTASGLDTTSNTTLQSCDWEKDYFTSCRPWPQKGATVSLPLGSNPNIWSTGSGGAATVNMATSGATSAVALSSGNTVAGNALFLSGAAMPTVDSLRQTLAVYRFEEARARYGSRYTEYLRYLGVRSSDARLQRPEYLGGGKQTIQFSEILQTAEGTNPVGMLRGHGISAMRSNRFRRFFEEHGIIISLISVRPKTIYIQGVHRLWNRRVKEDFWQKELEHIGQDIVKNKEIFAASGTPDATFGYQDMYDSYRRHWSGVAGDFRSNTLNYWHMARDFASQPALNNTFVSCNPTNRIYAATSATQLYMMINHSVQARRLVSRSAGESWVR